MFLDKEAVSKLAYPQSLRNFQVSFTCLAMLSCFECFVSCPWSLVLTLVAFNWQISDLAFHFNAAREASIEAESKDAQSIDPEPVSRGSQLPPSLEERMAQMRSLLCYAY